jgi:hypothetical protein
VRRRGVDEMRAMPGPCEMPRNERSGGVAFLPMMEALEDAHLAVLEAVLTLPPPRRRDES